VSGYRPDGVDRPRRWLVAASLGLAGVAAAGYLFFSTAGDQEPEQIVQVTPIAAGEATGTDDVDPEPTLESLPVVTYEVFLDRDPFEPALREQTGSGDVGEQSTDSEPDPEPPTLGAGLPAGTIVIDPATGQAVVVQASAVTDFEPGTDDGVTGAPQAPFPTSPGCHGEDEVVCEGHVVILVGVSPNATPATATIQVDDVVYEVENGQVFATSFRLLAIDSSCVSLLYGDETVRLCEGQRVLK
jgi:hypothetical protein